MDPCLVRTTFTYRPPAGFLQYNANFSILLSHAQIVVSEASRVARKYSGLCDEGMPIQPGSLPSTT